MDLDIEKWSASLFLFLAFKIAVFVCAVKCTASRSMKSSIVVGVGQCGTTISDAFFEQAFEALGEEETEVRARRHARSASKGISNKN